MRKGHIMIIPQKTDDGLWYGLAWFGILDTTEEESIFTRVPNIQVTKDRNQAIEYIKQSALELLQKQGIAANNVRVEVTSEEE